jgi:hypothetical protein
MLLKALAQVCFLQVRPHPGTALRRALPLSADSRYASAVALLVADGGSVEPAILLDREHFQRTRRNPVHAQGATPANLDVGPGAGFHDNGVNSGKCRTIVQVFRLSESVIGPLMTFALFSPSSFPFHNPFHKTRCLVRLTRFWAAFTSL